MRLLSLLFLGVIFNSLSSEVVADLLILDDFEDGDLIGWTPVANEDDPPASWSVSGIPGERELRGRGDANQAEFDSLILNDSPVGPDPATGGFLIDVEVRYFVGRASPSDPPVDEAVYVILRYRNSENYIYLAIDPCTGCSGVFDVANIRIKELVDGVVSELASFPVAHVDSGNLGHLRVTLSDLRATVEWQGTISFDDLLPFVNEEDGCLWKFGLGVADGDSQVNAGLSQFDNVTVVGTDTTDLADGDGDGLADVCDNCPTLLNPDQRDSDADDIGNACECGDFDGDGFVNTTDARLIQRCAVGQVPCIGLCDVTAEGTCDTTDARLIQRLAVGQLTKEDLSCAERP